MENARPKVIVEVVTEVLEVLAALSNCQLRCVMTPHDTH